MLDVALFVRLGICCGRYIGKMMSRVREHGIAVKRRLIFVGKFCVATAASPILRVTVLGASHILFFVMHGIVPKRVQNDILFR